MDKESKFRLRRFSWKIKFLNIDGANMPNIKLINWFPTLQSLYIVSKH